MNSDHRKLTAIFFSDIAGYSQMMSDNEAEALKHLNFHDTISAKIVSENGGKIIKRLGDGLLAEFVSVKSAVDAAKKFQQTLQEYNETRESGTKLIIRIGIHTGDVLVRDGDIIGNEVNVAARLQQICTPGGICLSEAAYSVINQKEKSDFIKIPDNKLKNIAENYTVYQSQSIYPEIYPQLPKPIVEPAEKTFVIKSMNKISPEKFSLFDSFLFSLLGLFLLYVLMVAGIKITTRLSFEEIFEVIDSEPFWVPYSIFFIVIFTLSFLRDAVMIKFEDVRGADHLLSYIIRRFGFSAPQKKGEEIVFKPTLYNRLLWMTQKMRVSIHGNHVTVSGSYLFLRRVKKMLRQYIPNRD
jgi:class 3 adenylate cyclase